MAFWINVCILVFFPKVGRSKCQVFNFFNALKIINSTFLELRERVRNKNLINCLGILVHFLSVSLTLLLNYFSWTEIQVNDVHMNINDYQLLVPLFTKNIYIYWNILILIFIFLDFLQMFQKIRERKSRQLQQCEIFYSLLTLTRIQIRQTIDWNQWPFICWLMIMKMKYIFSVNRNIDL